MSSELPTEPGDRVWRRRARQGLEVALVTWVLFVFYHYYDTRGFLMLARQLWSGEP